MSLFACLLIVGAADELRPIRPRCEGYTWLDLASGDELVYPGRADGLTLCEVLDGPNGYAVACDGGRFEVAPDLGAEVRRQSTGRRVRLEVINAW